MSHRAGYFTCQLCKINLNAEVIPSHIRPIRFVNDELITIMTVPIVCSTDYPINTQKDAFILPHSHGETTVNCELQL